MRKKKGLGYHRRRKLLINLVMLLITLALLMPLWYVLNNAFKAEQEIVRRPLVLRPQDFTMDSVIRAFRALKYPARFLNSSIILVVSCSSW